jgi:hypothetical protein
MVMHRLASTRSAGNRHLGRSRRRRIGLVTLTLALGIVAWSMPTSPATAAASQATAAASQASAAASQASAAADRAPVVVLPAPAAAGPAAAGPATTTAASAAGPTAGQQLQWVIDVSARLPATAAEIEQHVDAQALA